MLDRIVVINDDMQESGGASAVALTSVRLLSQRGVPVTVLSGDHSGAAPVPLETKTVRLGGRHIMSGKRVTAALRGLYDPRIARAVASWIADNDTPRTIYHLHNWHKVLSPAVFQALRPVASRLLISAHDYFLVCPTGGYFRYPQQTVCEITPGSTRCLLASCDRRHYGHKLWRSARHQLRRFLLDLAGARAEILLVHDGMVPHFVRAGIPRAQLQVLRNAVLPWRASRVPAEVNRDVFFVGRLEVDKGVDLLARAAQRAGAGLRIIGAGSLEAAIRREHPAAELLGWRSREQVSELASAARIVVIPTRCRETFGLVAVEALLSGIPVIVSQFALISEEIVRHGFGSSCNPYDEVALADAIGSLSGDDARVREISVRAFTGARQLAPTPEQWCDGLLRICESKLAIARPRRPPDVEQVFGGDADLEKRSWHAGKTGAVMGMSDGRS